MYRYPRRLLWLLSSLIAVATLSVWGLHSVSLARQTLHGGTQTYLPLLFTSPPIATSTPTPTPTSTPMPTPTATLATPACPLDDVTGSYTVETSNLEHNCPGVSIEPPPPGTAQIVQDGTTLTFRSEAGDATGTINPQTGAFEVTVTLGASAELCPFGCVNTTSGSFDLARNPVTYTGAGRLRILGPFGVTICSVTYDLAGTRTGCDDTNLSSHPGAPSGQAGLPWLALEPPPGRRLP